MLRQTIGPGCLAIAAACAGGDRGDGGAGTADTLASGRIVVHSPAVGEWDSAGAWTPVEELRIGSVDASGPALFGSVAGIDVDARGRIHVLDRNAGELRIFAADGSHLRTVGRKGGGPGEFGDPIGIVSSDAGELWVVDPGNARFAVFDTAGDYVTSHPRRISSYAVPWRGAFDRQGRLLEAASARTGTRFRGSVIRYDARMEPIDTFFAPEWDGSQYQLTNPQGTVSTNVPYAPSLVWTFDTDGGMWSGVSGEYRLFRQTLAGDTVREISRAYEHHPVTAAERDSAIARLSSFARQGGHLDPSRIPDRKPAFSRIEVAPDGHVWVRVTPPAGAAGTTFDVFDPAGRYLGEVRFPMRVSSALLFRGDRIYAVALDSLDVASVVRFRIAR